MIVHNGRWNDSAISLSIFRGFTGYYWCGSQLFFFEWSDIHLLDCSKLSWNTKFIAGCLLILQAWTNHSWAQNHGYQGLSILYEPLLPSYIILQIMLSLVYNYDVIACIYTELLIHYCSKKLLIHYVVAFLLNNIS
jgi:hypothetical protein